MGRRRAKGRDIHGVLILNKPSGMSSNDALQKAKRLFFAAKAGHTGSLDPLATGVLPICFGEATKFSQFVLESDKEYRSTFTLGIKTETSDSDGEVVEREPAPHVTREQVEKALTQFEGDIEQIPSMYSAIKHNGQPLYKLARKGITVEREPRQVTIFRIDLLGFRPGEFPEVDVEVHCSKGTYIRSIAEDLGAALGCGAHVSALHRTGAGPFDESQTFTLEELTEERGEGLAEQLDHNLLPVDAAVDDLPKVELAADSAHFLRNGQPVMVSGIYQIAAEHDKVRVFAEDGLFLGVAEVTDEGTIAPRRLVVDIK